MFLDVELPGENKGMCLRFRPLPDYLLAEVNTHGRYVRAPTSPHPGQHAVLTVVKLFANQNKGDGG